MEQAGVEIAYVGADQMGQGRFGPAKRQHQGGQTNGKQTRRHQTPSMTAVRAMVR